MWQFQIPLGDLKIKPAAELRIIDIEAFADLNNDAISDITVIMGDSKAQFFIGISGSNGELLWQFPLNTSCIPTNQSISIHSVLSNSCFKEPGNSWQKSCLNFVMSNYFFPCRVW